MPAFPDSERRNVLEPDCQRCPALVESRECISWGNGPLNAQVMVVGEAPGAGDPAAERWQGGNWTGMAYTSRHSGRRIRSLLEAVGIGSNGAYFTNAVKCFPAGDDGSNREPTAAERANCRPYLKREIETVSPSVILPTGNHATTSIYALEGKTVDSFLDHVLKPRKSPTLGVTVLPLLHPSYQDVWVSRLGYTNESYRDEIATQLDELLE